MKRVSLISKLRFCIPLLIVGCGVFLIPEVSSAHALSPQLSIKPMTAFSITRSGQQQTLRVLPGKEIIIPAKNGGSIHLNMGFIPSKSNVLKGIVPNNGSIPYDGCGTATANASYYGAFSQVDMSYTLSDFFCNNAVAITFINAPADSWHSVIGTTLVSHSTSHGWIQNPWSAYAQGSYNFLIGIPTPWGGIGANCGGSIQIDMIGDGPYFNYFTNC